MKRVLCLYRVSTVGQVDHDDIPMQRIACREYASTHPDWEITEEISEKGVSGYKVSTNERDAIIEIKKKAIAGEFDVLLVFMFDRLGRREDETPFVVQWFVQQGIEVWSTREGEQRFDTHVDKLLNYIRFWQASGESEKTSIRVKTKHLQMIEEGQYRGGLLPYGYKLVHLGRTNKKNQPVRDLVIDEDEAVIVRKIFHLLVDDGFGTVRVANYLNNKGIKTKRGTTLWRGTSIRALIDNPIYIGHMHIQLSGKLCNFSSGKLVARGDDRGMDRLQEALREQDLLILCNHLMRHNIFDPENVPDGVCQRLGMISLRSGKRQLIKCLIRKSHHDLRDLLKQTVSQFEEFLHPLTERGFLREEGLYLFVHR